MTTLLVVALLASSSAAEQPEAKPRLLVVDLTVEEGVSGSTARLLNHLLLSRLQATGRFDVFGQADLRSMLELEREKQLLGCFDVLCISEIAGALGADRTLFGSVGAIGDMYLVNLTLLNNSRAQVEARWSENVEGEQSQLIAAVERGVAALVQDLPTETAPEGAAADQETGENETGHKETSDSGAQTATSGALQPMPEVSASEDDSRFYHTWWFWTAVGVAVAGVAVSTYLIVDSESSPGRAGPTEVSVTLPMP
ncbi:hypothetical protein ACFL6C_07655 [Myxococcota bacterium]